MFGKTAMTRKFSYLFIVCGLLTFLNVFSKPKNDFELIKASNDVAINDTITAQSPNNLRLEDFLYYPYGFLKPEYKDLTYAQLLRYISTFHAELSIDEEKEGDNLILRIDNLKGWNKNNISIKATFTNNGKLVCYGVSTTPAVCWYEGLMKDLKKRGYRDVTYERKEYWHYVKGYRSDTFRYSKDRPLYCKYDGSAKVFYPAEIECYCYDCNPYAYLIFHY